MPLVPVASRRPVIVLALLLSGCVVALSLQARRPGGQTVAEGWLLDVTGVGLRVLTGAREGIVVVRRWAAFRASLEAQNASLLTRNLDLERELLDLRDAERERRRLLQLFAAHPSAPPTSRVARMVSLVTAGPFHSALLDRGRQDGIEVGGIAVGIRGLLGRVVGVGERTARVQLLSDRLAAVGVLLPRSGRVAVARGTGAGGIAVEYVPVIADVVADETVVTSGTDGIYPKDLPVGTIESVRRSGASLFLDLPVRLAADPERESTVFVFPPLTLPEPGADGKVPEPATRTPGRAGAAHR